jgi:hypothetical protein
MADQTDTTQVPGVTDVVEQPVVESTEQQHEFELPFRLEDVNDEFSLEGQQAREWLTARQAQMQSAFTRKMQELGDQRKGVESLAEIQARLESEATRTQALNELLEPYGFALPDDDEEPDDDIPGLDLDDPVAAELAELRAFKESLEAERQQQSEQQAQQQADETFQRHVVSEMSRVAGELGQKVEDMPEHIKRDVVTRALALPKRPDGLPDFDAALASHLEFMQEVTKLDREAYLASKQVPTVPGGGGSGVPVRDLTSQQDRLAAANAVAGRHFAKL